jgi:hypothetical protein
MNNATCFRLLRQTVWSPLAFARASVGNNMLARMAMIAITTSNSIKVKPRPGTALARLVLMA